MTSRLLSNGLSRRTNRCLFNASISINKQVIIRALQTRKALPLSLALELEQAVNWNQPRDAVILGGRFD
jgi:hypothetical protein